MTVVTLCWVWSTISHLISSEGEIVIVSKCHMQLTNGAECKHVACCSITDILNESQQPRVLSWITSCYRHMNVQAVTFTWCKLMQLFLLYSAFLQLFASFLCTAVSVELKTSQLYLTFLGSISGCFEHVTKVVVFHNFRWVQVFGHKAGGRLFLFLFPLLSLL